MFFSQGHNQAQEHCSIGAGGYVGGCGGGGAAAAATAAAAAAAVVGAAAAAAVLLLLLLLLLLFLLMLLLLLLLLGRMEVGDRDGVGFCRVEDFKGGVGMEEAVVAAWQ